MERKIYKSLLDWKREGSIKPLMVIGARQIGKTYTIREFGHREFPELIEFNLFDRKDICELFAQNINTQEKIYRLELMIGHAVDFEHSLLFFDEVQESEELIEALKFFAESEQHYNIICAGSLLGVKLKRFGQSFPVGKVSMLQMSPMDFEEYLNAGDQKMLLEHIRECFLQDMQMVDPLHKKCLDMFRRYLCVGGMPEAVSNLLANGNDVLRFNRNILSDIYQSYLGDMSKYIHSSMETARIEAIYNSIPSQLGNTSHKFQYAKVRKGAKSRDLISALSWLFASGMVVACHAVSQPSMPLKGYLDPDVFKLFLNDPGLLASLLDIRFPDIMLDTAFPYKGVLNESYVAGQLAAARVPLYYWREGSGAEVDFLIDTPGGIVPLEVKSGANKKTPSLRRYEDTFKPPWAIRVTARNFGFAGGIKSVPLYAVFCIPSLL